MSEAPVGGVTPALPSRRRLPTRAGWVEPRAWVAQPIPVSGPDGARAALSAMDTPLVRTASDYRLRALSGLLFLAAVAQLGIYAFGVLAGPSGDRLTGWFFLALGTSLLAGYVRDRGGVPARARRSQALALAAGGVVLVAILLAVSQWSDGGRLEIVGGGLIAIAVAALLVDVVRSLLLSRVAPRLPVAAAFPAGAEEVAVLSRLDGLWSMPLTRVEVETGLSAPLTSSWLHHLSRRRLISFRRGWARRVAVSLTPQGRDHLGRRRAELEELAAYPGMSPPPAP